MKNKSITIVIPTLNEEKSIGSVIRGFQKLGFTNILVVDGGSTDRTREIARSLGARVVVQSGKGKGQAIQEAFSLIDSDIAVIIDGDGTYLPEDIHKLLEPIEKGVADHVIGNRFASFERGAFTRLNLIGNKILNFLFRILYGENISDLLTGYRALTKKLYKSINLKHHGFEVETELTVQTIAKGFRIIEVPIRYRKREGKTKLHPLIDGFRIGKAIVLLLFQYIPGKAFYILGLALVASGLLTGVKTVLDWMNNISHPLMATLTSLLIVSGLLFIMFGILTSSLMRVISEMRREIAEVKEILEKKQF